MKVSKKKIITEGLDYYIQNLNLINTLLGIGMTEKEIAIVAHFLNLPYNVKLEGFLDTYSKKLIRENLNLSNAGLSNYIKNLTMKKVLDRDEETGRVSINPQVIPEEGWQGYQIKIENSESRE